MHPSVAIYCHNNYHDDETTWQYAKIGRLAFHMFTSSTAYILYMNVDKWTEWTEWTEWTDIYKYI